MPSTVRTPSSTGVASEGSGTVAAVTSGSVPVQEGLFDTGGGAASLVGGRCRVCDRTHFPLSPTCPWCSADETERTRLPATGTLWAWTAVLAPPPGYRGDVPFGFGVVELDDGLRVVTRLTETDPGRLSFGQRMRLTLVPLHTDDEGRQVTSWAFAPEPAALGAPAEGPPGDRTFSGQPADLRGGEGEFAV
jgi:uncharacterized OB-fold protein